MAKFKVGDRVVVSKLCSPLWHRYYGDSTKNAEIVCVLSDGAYHTKLESKLWDDDGLWIVLESELTPLAPIPDGWTPASEPPDGIRDVLVMLKGGEKRLGWYSESAIFPSGGKWYLYPEGTTPKSIDDDTSFDDTPAAPGEVLAWREIEPKRDPRVRYVVVAIPTLYDTLEEAELHAQRTVESLHVNVVIARVVEEVKPGKPVITKLEE